MKKNRRQLGVLLLWVWVLFFCEIFLLPLWKKIRRSLVAVSSNKNLTLEKLCFFGSLKLFFFPKPHHFFYFFIREHFSARKCSLCKTMACTDRKSHKQWLLLLWDNRLLKKERDACRRFCFLNPQNSETSKGPPQYIFAVDKGFPRIFAMPLPCFVQQNFCSLVKRNWNFCKISDKTFLKLLLWTRKAKFWYPCEKFYKGGRNCFVLCPNMLKGKTYSFWTVFLKWFFQTGTIQLCQTHRNKLS